MNPITLARSCATSNSLFVIALCIDSNRPELGFQSNHSDRRLSNAGASVFKALLTMRPLTKAHLGPSGTSVSQTHPDKVSPGALNHACLGVVPPGFTILPLGQGTYVKLEGYLSFSEGKEETEIPK